MSNSDPAADLAALRRRHLRRGWLLLGLFVAVGAGLEAMHGFKVDWYLAVGNETRRLLWRLAHAHGTFLGLLHIAFALTVPHCHRVPRLCGACLTGAAIALPAGFFFGGVGAIGGDPGLGILLVPLGVALLLIAVVQVAMALGGSGADRDHGAAP